MKLENSIKMVNVDLDYVASLHEACSEVFFQPKYYEKKPYIGILVSTNSNKYVIPLTSAKEKHKSWKNVYFDRMLIYEYLPENSIGKLSDNSIHKSVHVDGEEKIKHIIAAIDIKKMIPITDSVYSVININHEESDTDEDRSYKDLVTKELRFCIKAKDDIIRKASSIYNKQMATGKIVRFGCDFRALEDACARWSERERK